MRYTLLVGMLFFIAKAECQIASHTPTTAACTAVVVGHDNTINCGALTPEEAQKLAAILNEVRSSNLSLDVILGKLDAILAEIRKNANPNRAVVSYDPNGNQRTTYGEHLRMDTSGQLIYRQFLEFQKMGWWGNEAELAEKEERERPEWLSPILFAAEAYLNLCRVKDAASNLNEFIAKASDEPDYDGMVSDAKQGLTKLHMKAEECHVQYP